MEEKYKLMTFSVLEIKPKGKHGSCNKLKGIHSVHNYYYIRICIYIELVSLHISYEDWYIKLCYFCLLCSGGEKLNICSISICLFGP